MSLLDKVSLCITPNAYKEDVLYSVVPSDRSGDLNVVRATTATRVNADGLIESVGINVPRLDYTNGSCPSILVEPQRTNLVTYSEQFDNASWTKLNAIVTPNFAISPDGTQNADRIQFTVTSTSSVYRAIGGATTDANTIYVKGVAGEKVLFGYGANVSVGTLFTLNGEWQRLEQISTTGTVYSIGNFSGGTASDILVWGAQREAGSYATSYIPTVASTVTRNADVISKTGISDLIGQTEGTLFFEINAPNPNSPSGVTMIQLGLGTSRIYISKESNTQNIFQLATQSASGYNFINSSIITTSTIKFAIAYKNGDNAFYVNGALVSSASATANPTSFSQMNFGDISVGNTDIKVKSATLWKTRLSNTELAQLTTI